MAAGHIFFWLLKKHLPSSRTLFMHWILWLCLFGGFIINNSLKWTLSYSFEARISLQKLRPAILTGCDSWGSNVPDWQGYFHYHDSWTDCKMYVACRCACGVVISNGLLGVCLYSALQPATDCLYLGGTPVACAGNQAILGGTFSKIEDAKLLAKIRMRRMNN